MEREGGFALGAWAWVECRRGQRWQRASPTVAGDAQWVKANRGGRREEGKEW